MCAVILSSEERERLSKANAQRYREYLQWIERLPEPFKTFYQTRFLWAWLIGPVLIILLLECGKPPRQTIDPSAANAAIEQTRPSESQTTLPASTSSPAP